MANANLLRTITGPMPGRGPIIAIVLVYIFQWVEGVVPLFSEDYPYDKEK